MKKILHFLLVLSVSFLNSCQTEEYEVITEQDQNTITTGMEVYDLVYRAAMHDGSADDEIDNSPCFSIEFPYTVTFRGEEIHISSRDARNSFLANLPSDAQDIIPNFPITITNAAHQKVSVMNRQQYAGLQQACRNRMRERGGPITCGRFSFPLQVTSYDRDLQQTASTIINSQKDLYTYFNRMTANEIVNFVYPLEIIRKNGVIPVSNRSELEDVLASCGE